MPRLLPAATCSNLNFLRESNPTASITMTSKLSKLLTSWLIHQGAISKNEEELYQYASYLIISTMTPTITVLLLGTMIHISPIKCLCFSSSFIILRKYTGGFHFHSQTLCFITSSMVELLFLYLADSSISPLLTNSFFLFSCLSLLIFSPVVSSARILDSSEKHRCRLMTCRILAILSVICYLCYNIGLKRIISYPEYAVIMTAILQYPAILRRCQRK